jgi:plasmid stabilization system protein ParE
VALNLEYLEEALVEAEAAARWYAQRSLSAAAAFSAEIKAAEESSTFQKRGRSSTHGTRRYLLRRYPFNVIYRTPTRILTLLGLVSIPGRP